MPSTGTDLVNTGRHAISSPRGLLRANWRRSSSRRLIASRDITWSKNHGGTVQTDSHLLSNLGHLDPDEHVSGHLPALTNVRRPTPRVPLTHPLSDGAPDESYWGGGGGNTSVKAYSTMSVEMMSMQIPPTIISPGDWVWGPIRRP